jgi:hypothetical protein
MKLTQIIVSRNGFVLGEWCLLKILIINEMISHSFYIFVQIKIYE